MAVEEWPDYERTLREIERDEPVTGFMIRHGDGCCLVVMLITAFIFPAILWLLGWR